MPSGARLRCVSALTEMPDDRPAMARMDQKRLGDSGVDMTDAEWLRYLAGFHRDQPGVTERVR